MIKGRSIKREKLPKDIIKMLILDRKKFASDNAQRIAIGINPRTFKVMKEENAVRTDVLEKIKNYLSIIN